MSTRGINEMYVYGGSQHNTDPVPTSTYVARIEPGTLKELWRTCTPQHKHLSTMDWSRWNGITWW